MPSHNLLKRKKYIQNLENFACKFYSWKSHSDISKEAHVPAIHSTAAILSTSTVPDHSDVISTSTNRYLFDHSDVISTN